ncbi:MAG TPA: DUF748 domain-containing protein [Bacteroidales bacterium]|jgi:hypothetical protein|nr:DUF748 domain-containing protein [Bacteroidales bacterium]
MNTRKKSLKKFLLKSLLIIGIIVLLLIAAASPLVKYVVQKYDVKYTGREITVDRVFVNPLSGAVRLRNFRIYEENSDSVFMYIKRFKTNLSILKLLSGTYELTSLSADQPDIHIIRTDSLFNFSDLIRKFSGNEKDTTKPPAHFNLKHIRINDGLVRYHEYDFPSEINLAEINFSSSGMMWNVDTIAGKFSLVPGNGNLSGDFTVNKASMDYRLSLDLSKFNINLLQPYLTAMAENAVARAEINIGIDAKGNFKEPLNGQARGKLEIDSLHFGRAPDKDFFAIDRFLVKFNEINLKDNKFYFDSILISKPVVLYQKYDTLDNFRRMFSTYLAKKAKEKAKEAADTISMLVSLLGSDYYVGSLALTDGNIEFNDYSLAEKFTFRMHDFTIKADTIDKSKRRVKVHSEGKISPAGSFTADISLNPKDEKDFSLEYRFRDIPAPMFNPYLITYTSYPLDKGTIEMHGKWTVVNSNINSLNHFLAIEPRSSEKQKGKNTKWVPMPLIMAFVRERGSVIDYEIPIKGDLNNPKFKLGDVITDLLRNILVKPPTTPYGMQVRAAENKIEKTLTVKWQMRQASIGEDQEKFLKGVADFLKENKEARIVVQPVFYEEKEKENILFFEAKKKYFVETGKKGATLPLSKDDSLKIGKMSTNDHSFKKFLNSKFNDPAMLTLQERCYRFVGSDVVNQKYKQLIRLREESFVSYFRKNNTDDRIEMLKLKEEMPVNWFSYYRLNYKGDIPESLREAFNKLFELNSEPPRKEYFNFLRRK